MAYTAQANQRNDIALAVAANTPSAEPGRAVFGARIRTRGRGLSIR